jgi:O-antigen/teichoic acid export membrane protein
MISRVFFKSSIIYSIVGALPYASGFLLLPWFTNYLTPQQFGINALYIALMYFIQIISSYGMDMTVSVLYFDYKNDKAKLREFLGTVFIGIAILGAITFMIFSLGGLRLFNFVFNSTDFWPVYDHLRGFQQRVQNLFQPAYLPAAAGSVFLAQHFQFSAHNRRVAGHPLYIPIYHVWAYPGPVDPGSDCGLFLPFTRWPRVWTCMESCLCQKNS